MKIRARFRAVFLSIYLYRPHVMSPFAFAANAAKPHSPWLLPIVRHTRASHAQSPGMRLSHEMERPATITPRPQAAKRGRECRATRPAVTGITLFTVDFAGCKLLLFRAYSARVEIIAIAANLIRKIAFVTYPPRSACNRQRCVGFRARPSGQWQQGTRCRRPPENKLRGHRGTVCNASAAHHRFRD